MIELTKEDLDLLIRAVKTLQNYERTHSAMESILTGIFAENKEKRKEMLEKIRIECEARIKEMEKPIQFLTAKLYLMQEELYPSK